MFTTMILWKYRPIKCKRQKYSIHFNNCTLSCRLWMKLSSEIEGSVSDVILPLSGQKTALLLQPKAAADFLHNYKPFYVSEYCDAFVI